MIERMGPRFADNLESPRLLKTHFTWDNVPKNRKSKYILAVRNPKDCLTRYTSRVLIVTLSQLLLKEIFG